MPDPVLQLQHYLAVGAIMFVIGMIGFMTRRNLIVMFLCTELMFQGVAINLIAFGRYHNNFAGHSPPVSRGSGPGTPSAERPTWAGRFRRCTGCSDAN